ncbi:hypothetical protein KMT30_45220 [Streptomyces sp. IBSBF 2953]|uniref:hypothetical protein n=1 Tax=Streptomyces TaxID=1883 RepID=UPI00211A569D|nr:hypothetical protein [Streptomyces scabiei]MCQ9186116.1 hypothetical protein [Streptomyces hayashii]MDX3119696.1 hypothetical protein [Streptomyces scabiei]
MSGRISARRSAPCVRAVAAAVLTVTALITAANAGPATTTVSTPSAPVTRHDAAERH